MYNQIMSMKTLLADKLKHINLDFSKFNFNLFLQNQIYTSFKILFASWYKLSIVSSDIRIAVSSAKLMNYLLLSIFIFNKSFIKKINNNGPKTVPCGTPQVISLALL